MLLRNEILELIVAGKISVVFRSWKRPTVKTGGTLTTRQGVLSIDKVEPIESDDVSPDDLKKAGLDSKDDLPSAGPGKVLYRIALHYHGEDPRIALRENTDRSELDRVTKKLGQMGDWPLAYLRLIGSKPNTHAQILAETIGLEKAPFKRRVRRLKSLGLTESLSPGYRLSKRGKKVLEILKTTQRS